jgi:hypothetical protein
VLELYQHGLNQATERWDLVFNYADPNKEDVSSEDEADAVWKAYLDKLLMPAGKPQRDQQLNLDAKGGICPKTSGRLILFIESYDI